jgi:hypothetical protein
MKRHKVYSRLVVWPNTVQTPGHWDRLSAAFGHRPNLLM